MNKYKPLTLKRMGELYNEARMFNSSSMVIPSWKIPLLWAIFPFFGYAITSENWRMYWVDFRGVKYLLKSKSL